MPILTSINKQLTILSFAGDGDPIYQSLTLDQASYNEGDTITATVITSNIDDGTTVDYTVQGVSASDVSGNLNGQFTINSNTASVQFTIIQDGLTEGTDNFRITLVTVDSNGDSTNSLTASASIIDTSNDPTRTPWLDDNDDIVTVNSIISPIAMQLNAVFAQNPTVPITIEGRDSGAETTITNIAANTGSILEVDDNGNSTSFVVGEEINLADVTVDIVPASTSVDEGSSLGFTVNTTSLPNGFVLYWSVSRPEDFTISSGSFTINNNTSLVTVTPAEDSVTEGTETFTFSVRSQSVNGNILGTSDAIEINDTSIDPIYVVSLDANSYNEGDTVTVNLATTRVSDNTTVNYTISGVASSDVSKIAGTLTVTGNSASDTFTIAEDATTEGEETFTVTLAATDSEGQKTTGVDSTNSDSATINDTSTDPTYTLSSDDTNVNETTNRNFTITLNTTNVPDGTSVPYTILPPESGTAITQSDLSVGSMTGAFIINNNSGTLDFEIAEDETTEVPIERMNLALNNGQDNIEIAINDTSTYPIEWVELVNEIQLSPRPGETVEGATPSSEDGPFNTYKSLRIDRPQGEYTNVFPNVENIGLVSGAWTIEFYVDNFPFGLTAPGTSYPLLTMDDDNAFNEYFVTVGVYPRSDQFNAPRLGLEVGTKGGATSTFLSGTTLSAFQSHLSLTFNNGTMELHYNGTRIVTATGVTNWNPVERIIFGGYGTYSIAVGFDLSNVVLRNTDTSGNRPTSVENPSNPSVIRYIVGREVLPTDKIYSVTAENDFTDPGNNIITSINETDNNTVEFVVECTNVTTDNADPVTVSWALTGVSLDDILSINGVTPSSTTGSMDILNLDSPLSYVGNWITVVMKEDYLEEGQETMSFVLGATDSDGDSTGSNSASVTIEDTSNILDISSQYTDFSNSFGGFYVGAYTNPIDGVHYDLFTTPLNASFEWATAFSGLNDVRVFDTDEKETLSIYDGYTSSYTYLSGNGGQFRAANWATTQGTNSQTDWYLPSLAESRLIQSQAYYFAQVEETLSDISTVIPVSPNGDPYDYYYWTTTENTQDQTRAWANGGGGNLAQTVEKQRTQLDDGVTQERYRTWHIRRQARSSRVTTGTLTRGTEYSSAFFDRVITYNMMKLTHSAATDLSLFLFNAGITFQADITFEDASTTSIEFEFFITGYSEPDFSSGLINYVVTSGYDSLKEDVEIDQITLTGYTTSANGLL